MARRRGMMAGPSAGAAREAATRARPRRARGRAAREAAPGRNAACGVGTRERVRLLTFEPQSAMVAGSGSKSVTERGPARTKFLAASTPTPLSPMTSTSSVTSLPMASRP